MAFKKRWKPNASQKAAFIARMQDPAEQDAYNQRKAAKALYDNWKDKSFVPTQEQHRFCIENYWMTTGEQRDAFRMVTYGYTCQEKVNHQYIHVVNQLRRGEVEFEKNKTSL